MSSPISFAGIASGIDTNALLNAQLASMRQTRIVPKEEKVTELENANQAFDELKALLETFRAEALEFSTLAGGSLTKTGISSNENSVLVTTTNSAQAGSYTISSITSIAKNHTFSFNETFSSTGAVVNSGMNDGAPAADRTISIGIGTVKSLSIEMTSSTTLAGLASEINSQGDGYVNASLVNVGNSASPAYKLFITSTNTGTEKGLLTVTNGSEVGAIGGRSESAASDAQFTIAGIDGIITRSTNTVSDVLIGTTLELQNTTASPITLNINTDIQRTSTQVKSLINTYNEIIKFVKANNQVTRDESGTDVTNNFAPLSQATIDDSVLEQLREDIISSVNTGGSSVKIFADLGITTEKDGTLAFDEDDFEAAITAESSSVEAILTSFADSISSTGGTIDLYTRFNGFFDLSINSNKDQVSILNSRIQDIEAQLARQEESMRARFGRLEGIIGRLNSVQSSLASTLGG